MAAVGLADLLAAVLGLGAGQGGDGLLARDITLGGLVIFDLRGAAPTFAAVGLFRDIPPAAAVGRGLLPRGQHLTGALAREWVPLPLLLLQLPFQELLLSARGLLCQLRLVLLLLSPGCKVAIVHILKVFGDRVLIVTVCSHLLFWPVRKVAILEETGGNKEENRQRAVMPSRLAPGGWGA